MLGLYLVGNTMTHQTLDRIGFWSLIGWMFVAAGVAMTMPLHF